MRFLLLWLDRKIGSSFFLRHCFLLKIRLHRTLQRVLLHRIPPMSRVSVPPPLRFSGTFPFCPVEPVCSLSLCIVHFEYAWMSFRLSFCSSAVSSLSIVDVKYAWISLFFCSSGVSMVPSSVSVFWSSSSDSISSMNGV